MDRDENAVVLINRERTVRVPAALVGALLLGPGTRITHAAVGLLADSGTSVCWVGEHGVRMYASGLGPSRGAQVIQRQAELVSDPRKRIKVAREMFKMRFPDVDVSTDTMQQLRGKEGARVKRLYKEHSRRTGVEWIRRDYRAGDAFAAGDDVNRLLSAANSSLYGACHAAIVGVGASPALGFVHVGNALSFVLDIADLYKAEYTIPLAFDLAAAGKFDESDARFALRDKFAHRRFMARAVGDALRLIMGEQQVSGEDSHQLWDEFVGTVTGGINWDLDQLEGWPEYAVISGPEISTTAPPF